MADQFYTSMATNAHQPLLDSPRVVTSFSFFFLVSVAAILSSTALLATVRLKKVDTSNSPASLTGLCDHADGFQDSCLFLVSEISRNRAPDSDGMKFVELFLRDSAHRIDDTGKKVKLARLKVNDPREEAVLAVCAELMDLSSGRIMESIRDLPRVESRDDAHTWLSTVLTNHMTCLEELKGHAKDEFEEELMDLILRAKTVLSVFVSVLSSPAKGVQPFPIEEDFPTWLTEEDRKLLETSMKKIKADVVVAKDGSGNYTTVSDAVAAAPTNSKTRYVIYVKKGKYDEIVRLGSSLKNIMLVGDGMNSTVITGSLNVINGSTTFNSATVAAVGDGFIAQDICFQNTAGPEQHQAVALRVGADRSVINRCQIDAYQDTLYAHSNRQFYRDSNITGTVDFIFGNAAAVFQNCWLIARKPMSGQKNMVTAQGRTDPNQNTATSIQNCSIVASADLQPVLKNFTSYLGRPWKLYSRTVVMQSYIDKLISPAGWSVWDGDFALDTLYYGEYMNTGPGAKTNKRVNWTGYHIITNATVAEEFTVAQLIQGDVWLNSTGVNFNPGL